MLDVRERLAVVVGGGPVGLRKATALLAAGAAVRIVAESPPADPPSGAEIVVEPYRPEHLSGAALVFACTDDRALNAAIASDARQAGALVNAADQPDDCDFYLPAVLRKGELVVAIGTGGAAPALAGHLKETLAAALPSGVAEFVCLLRQIREELKVKLPDAQLRWTAMKRLAGPEGLDAFLEGGKEAVYNLLTQITARH